MLMLFDSWTMLLSDVESICVVSVGIKAIVEEHPKTENWQ